MPKYCTSSSSDFSCSVCSDGSCSSCSYTDAKPRRHYDAGTYSFTSIITPLSDLHTPHNQCVGGVEFRMRRKNKVVTLQWEGFKGRITTNGIAYLTVNQSICNLPPYPITLPIYIKYKGVGRITRMEIEPHGLYNIKFYLNADSSTTDINKDDNVHILAGCVNWIVD